MARLGHSSPRAAMIYQHATRDRDQAIAKALGTFVRTQTPQKASGRAGTGEQVQKAILWHARGTRTPTGHQDPKTRITPLNCRKR